MFSAFSDEQKQIVLGADCFCFDVDSTVCQDEAIDELAKFAGVYDEVSAVTKLSSMVELVEVFLFFGLEKQWKEI